MGILTVTVEALAVSSGLAALRMVTGYSVREYVVSRLTHPLLNTVASKYFDAGEYIVGSAVEFYNNVDEKDKKKKD